MSKSQYLAHDRVELSKRTSYTCTCGMSLTSKEDFVNHLVVSHISSDGVEGNCIWDLDHRYDSLAHLPFKKYSYKTEEVQMKDNPNIMVIKYPYVDLKCQGHLFDDVHKFVSYLVFSENILVTDTLQKLVYKSKQISFEKRKNVGEVKPVEMVQKNFVVEKMPSCFQKEEKQELEATLLEMSNYAAKCLNEGWLSIEENANVDLSEIIPMDCHAEPSTDHSSGKQRREELMMKSGDKPNTPVIAPFTVGSNQKENIGSSSKQKVKPDSGDKHKSDTRLHEKIKGASKTAMPSPPRNTKLSSHHKKASSPEQKRSEKEPGTYLGKREVPTPEQALAQKDVLYTNHKKPTYKSRNPSPGRGLKRPEVMKVYVSKQVAQHISSNPTSNKSTALKEPGLPDLEKKDDLSKRNSSTTAQQSTESDKQAEVYNTKLKETLATVSQYIKPKKQVCESKVEVKPANSTRALPINRGFRGLEGPMG